MTHINVPVQLLTNMLQYTEVSSMLTKRAMDENRVHQQAQQKAAALQADTLAHLVKLDVIPASEKEAAAIMLGAHDSTLGLVKAAADKIAEVVAENAQLRSRLTKKGSDLGRAEPDGSAPSGNGEYNSLTHPIVGEKTAYVKESDRALRRLIGK